MTDDLTSRLDEILARPLFRRAPGVAGQLRALFTEALAVVPPPRAPEPNLNAKVIIDLPDDGLSVSKRQYAGAKSWIKLLTGVDVTKSDGYAFEGTFCRFNETIEVPDGTWFLAYVEDKSSTGRLRDREVTLYRVTDGALNEIAFYRTGFGKGWALRCRDQIAAHLAGTPMAVVS
jgi:hypothetical protein